jgi:hypothetical protein
LRFSDEVVRGDPVTSIAEGVHRRSVGVVRQWVCRRKAAWPCDGHFRGDRRLGAAAHVARDLVGVGIEEETGYALTDRAGLQLVGAYYSLPSETNKYTHVFLADPVTLSGVARGDTELNMYFDMSVVLILATEALAGIGTLITSMETIGWAVHGAG